MLSQQYEYDVFLSFRGEDTRNGFTGHLGKALQSKGIHTFMDDQIHGKGEEIAPFLLNAIARSRTAIIVLSPNYASSSWCLKELSYILECVQVKGMLVFPVYYDVDPSHVRNQTGSFGEAFAKHEEKFKDDMERVYKWREALQKVSSLFGWDSRNGPEYQVIDDIVKAVSLKLNRISLPNIDYVFGIDSRIQEVLTLLELESDSDGALMMGIYGAAGIGKTTLAQVIYNVIATQFDAWCFLSSVRENSSIHGLVHLQKSLLSETVGEKDSYFTNVDMGILRIKNWLQRKKVLLVLDDVDTLEQLEALAGKPDWFGSGSRVIVTTRDKHLLAFHEVERTYEVQPLNPKDALDLLRHQVFKQGDVDSSDTRILNEFVSYASGLPLALKVIGSRLFGKSVEEWTSALHQFKRIPPKEIQKKLETSIDNLMEDEKSVFLDIACCFQGYKLSEALDILHAHHSDNVKYHIKVLIDKSLISISSDGKVILHPLIENMGKEIVRQENPKEPGKRSRLWYPEDIVQVLKNNTGTSSVEIIHLGSPLYEDEETIEWDGDAFKKMENLKTLIIRKCKFSQTAKYLPKSLRVLEYPSENLPHEFNPNQLVICKLPMKGIKSPKLVELTETLPNAPEVLQSAHSVPEVYQTPQNVSEVVQILQRVYENDRTYRVVGLVSSAVGLLCCGLSPSFKRLINGWNAFKISLYVAFSLAIITIFYFARQPSYCMNYVLGKVVRFAILMFIAVCTIYYDRAVNSQPEVWSVASNGAFAMMSVCLSNLAKFSHEMGVFTAFLVCFAIQLWTIHWMLISVAIIYGFPLFLMHYSPDSRQEVISGGQAVHSSTDTRQEVISEGQVVHSSSDTREHQHVIDVEDDSGHSTSSSLASF